MITCPNTRKEVGKSWGFRAKDIEPHLILFAGAPYLIVTSTLKFFGRIKMPLDSLNLRKRVISDKKCHKKSAPGIGVNEPIHL